MTEVYQTGLKSPSVPNLSETLKRVNNRRQPQMASEGHFPSSFRMVGSSGPNLRRRTRSLNREDHLSILDLYDGAEDSEGGDDTNRYETGTSSNDTSNNEENGLRNASAGTENLARDGMSQNNRLNHSHNKQYHSNNSSSNNGSGSNGIEKKVRNNALVGHYYHESRLRVSSGSLPNGKHQNQGQKPEARPLFMHSGATITSLNTVATSVTSLATKNTVTPSINSKNIIFRVNDSHYDRYGFKKQSQHVMEEEYNVWWEQYAKYCIRRKHKWKALLAKSGLGLDSDNPDRFPSKSEKLKRYVRKGIPAEWRGNAWWYFARGQEKLNKNKGIYDKLLAKTDDPNERAALKDLDVIERDLNRTFPDNIYFQKSSGSEEEPSMIQSLRRVLVAFSIYNPKIGYCQSMNFLSALLLLFMDEERAFWMLVIITSRYLPGVHNVNLEGVNIDQGVLMLCIKEYLPEFWGRICPEATNKTAASRNEFLYKLPPMTLCTASWFMSCFIGIVPIETTLRIWDCLFYEESHVLFKISLSIIKLSEPEFPQRNRRMRNRDDEDMEVFQVIQSFPKSLLDPNDIFDKIIFRKRIRFNSLNQEEIDRCRKYVASQRQKLKNFIEIMGERTPDSSRDPRIHHDMINQALSSEEYGFRRSLTGVHWNNSIKERVRQLSKRK